MSKVPQIRIRQMNRASVRASGKYVLYWMIANRRLRYNFSLDRALEHCAVLGKPLLVFEGLRVDYPWASERLHRFVLEGMADNARVCATRHVRYLAYVEPRPGDGKGLLAALSQDACAVVTDDFPCFFLPRMVERAAQDLPILLEAVDSNGLFPMHATNHVMLRAFDFRRLLQKELPSHLEHFPVADPFLRRESEVFAPVSTEVIERWPMFPVDTLANCDALLSRLPIDHTVGPGIFSGGSEAAVGQLHSFIEKRLPIYGESRNDLDHDVSSGLSAYLHFGHISAHETFAQIAQREQWKPQRLALRSTGKREGWWNMSASAEAFLDQSVTWRELGYNFSSHRSDYDCYDSLPDWAKKTLQKHERDNREHLYSLEQFEAARTADPLWNAAQTQLVREGKMRNYLRMLWGKKILEWTRTPHQALDISIHLNNKYALDGRNPNSYSGIFWIFGRYDRPWPERPVFGTIRYMSTTSRKLSIKQYLRTYGSGELGPRTESLPLF
jgi:deoxyribodipyrimidine photo-lyase